MDQPIIEVNNLTKVYRLGALGARSFAEETKAIFSKIIGKKFIPKDAIIDDQICSEGRLKNKNDFFALKDINFTVNKGEIVGIIGKNGAGKSTLLKILSRITEPTSGNAILRGRVGSLLEVGTGFHGDLTGRENTYLNGTILGMKRHEIDRKYEEIVTFAKLEKFMDTPVKRYSSGMFVRLAFSVAAHLESEILIIDEILAVGDQAFQDKCIGKMKDVSSKGRTVLFVSHNIQLIKKLCHRSILLHNGIISGDGLTLNVVKKYHGQNMQIEITEDSYLNNSKFRRGNGLARVNKFKVIDSNGVAKTTFNIGETISFYISFITKNTIQGAHISICFCSELLKEPIFYLNHTICEEKLKNQSKRTAIIRFNTQLLCAGSFHLWLGLQDQSRKNLDIISDILPVINLKNGDGVIHELGCVNLPSTAQRL